MSLVISLGSNVGDRLQNITDAKNKIGSKFQLLEESRVYTSEAVDYSDQPDFLNQVIVFEKPEMPPRECINLLLSIENELGRIRDIPKGPRTIDIDILFWELESFDYPNLQVPHPRLFQRSFIVLPLMELKVFKTLSNKFAFSESFCNEAFPLNSV